MSDIPELTAEDFRNADINQYIDEGSNCSDLCFKLGVAATECADSDSKKSSMLQLLARVSSMSIQAASIQEPLAPFCRWADGTCSAHIDCFSEGELKFLQTITSDISNMYLLARIHDLLWIRAETRDIRHARSAIDAYRSFPLTPESSCAWERGIRLTQLIGKGAENRIFEFREELLRLLFSEDPANDSYMMDILWLLQVCTVDEQQRSKVLGKFNELIVAVEEQQDHILIRAYCERALGWYSAENDQAEISRVKVKIAEAWVGEAENAPMQMTASGFFSRAVEVYRQIPRKHRDEHRVAERIEVLRGKMADSNRFAMEEFRKVHAHETDIGEYIDSSRKMMTGLSLQDALLTLVNVFPCSDKQQIEQAVKDRIDKFALRKLFGASHRDRDGRVISKSPAMDLGTPASDANEKIIWGDMVSHQNDHINLVTQGFIWPALCVFYIEHGITLRDVMGLCLHSPVVPQGREEIWAKGLYYGFDKRFLESLHILPFQVEHWIRTELQVRGCQTTDLSGDIEMELGLSSLLKHPRIEEVLEENLLFELRVVFTEQLGSNFRNNVAHGLIEPPDALSAAAVYMWWLCLKLVINNISWKPNSEEPVAKAETEK